MSSPSLTTELLWIGLILGSHAVAVVALIWHMLSPDDRDHWRNWRDWWPGDDDEPEPLPDPRTPGGLAVDLLDRSEPARVRLREPGRLADAIERPARRPDHAPERVPERERETV